MAWTQPKDTRLPELLTKLAELHQRLVELKVRQQLGRAVDQVEAFKSLYTAPTKKEDAP